MELLAFDKASKEPSVFNLWLGAIKYQQTMTDTFT